MDQVTSHGLTTLTSVPSCSAPGPGLTNNNYFHATAESQGLGPVDLSSHRPSGLPGAPGGGQDPSHRVGGAGHYNEWAIDKYAAASGYGGYPSNGLLPSSLTPPGQGIPGLAPGQCGPDMGALMQTPPSSQSPVPVIKATVRTSQSSFNLAARAQEPEVSISQTES